MCGSGACCPVCALSRHRHAQSGWEQMSQLLLALVHAAAGLSSTVCKGVSNASLHR